MGYGQRPGRPILERKGKHMKLESIDKAGIAIAALIVIGTFIAVIMAPGCADSDSDGGGEVEQCLETSEAMDRCVDISEMGTTLDEMKSECKKEDFDSYDRCLFDCVDKNSGCDAMIDCWDGC